MNATFKTSLAPIALGMLFVLTGCQTTGTTATTGVKASVCSIWPEISYSADKDTPRTVQEVREANASRNAYCE